VDPAETALRVLLGARAAAVVTALGEPLPTPDGGLTHLFPTAAAVAGSPLGLPPAVRDLADRLASGRLRLDEGADRDEVRDGLLRVRDLGGARAESLMLHAVGDPDAFPAADRALRAAAEAHGADLRRAESWRPWRAYGYHLLTAGR
jgi:AraC family transcriptional regulator of adaptative response / DNA-3-methyladenine glycosylase II